MQLSISVVHIKTRFLDLKTKQTNKKQKSSGYALYPMGAVKMEDWWVPYAYLSGPVCIVLVVPLGVSPHNVCFGIEAVEATAA